MDDSQRLREDIDVAALTLMARVKAKLPNCTECRRLFAEWRTAFRAALRSRKDADGLTADSALRTLLAALKQRGIETF